jgi:hypothetical protein
MATVRVTIRGVEVANARLSRLQGMAWAVRPMHQSVLLLQNRMAAYPPQRAGSAYVRTGTLGRRWTTRVQEIGNHTVLGTVGNNTTYAPWVQARYFQAGIHRGRWQTEMDVTEQSRDEIAALFQAAIERAANA